MNYAAIYDAFIGQCLRRPASLADHYHHIVPRCMGGIDEPANLVRLTHRQHIFAHLLLYKIHGTSEMRSSVMLLASGMRNKRMTARVKRICTGQKTYFNRSKLKPRRTRKVKQEVPIVPDYQARIKDWPYWQKKG